MGEGGQRRGGRIKPTGRGFRRCQPPLYGSSPGARNLIGCSAERAADDGCRLLLTAAAEGGPSTFDRAAALQVLVTISSLRGREISQ